MGRRSGAIDAESMFENWRAVHPCDRLMMSPHVCRSAAAQSIKVGKPARGPAATEPTPSHCFSATRREDRHVTHSLPKPSRVQPLQLEHALPGEHRASAPGRHRAGDRRWLCHSVTRLVANTRPGHRCARRLCARPRLVTGSTWHPSPKEGVILNLAVQRRTSLAVERRSRIYRPKGSH